MALLFDDNTDPIQAAIDYYREVSGYQATVAATQGRERQVIRYAFQKPGRVRMDFITPRRGAVLIYDPDTGVARLWPFGRHRFPALSLNPAHPLIQSPTGQRVDRSHVGILFDNVRALQRQGRAEVRGMETLHGHPVLRVDVSGSGGSQDRGVAAYHLWLDRDCGFPIKVASLDRDGSPIETVELTELCIAPDFPEDFFQQ